MAMYLTGNLNLFDQASAKEYGYDSVKDYYEDFAIQWTSTVTDNDHVFILGNLSQYAPEAALGFFQKLPGQKQLVIGPRDQISPDTKKGWMTAQHYREAFIYDNTSMRRRLFGRDCILSYYGPEADVYWAPRPSEAYYLTAWQDIPDDEGDPWVNDSELSISWNTWGRLVDWEEVKEMFEGRTAYDVASHDMMN